MHGARFRYFDFVMVAFVVVLLLSNVIGAEKRSVVNLPGVGLWPFGAGILFFPISYVIDDVLTEVYGYARARRAIGPDLCSRPGNNGDPHPPDLDHAEDRWSPTHPATVCSPPSSSAN